MGSVTQIYSKEHELWLPDHAYLWRYVPLKTLLVYLTQRIFIPSVETLRSNDPFEGRFHFYTGYFNTAMQTRYGDRVNALVEWITEPCSEAEKKAMERNRDYPNYVAQIFEDRYFAFLRKTRYAWCWFYSHSESAAMWNNYGNQGAAILTTVGNLKAILAATNRDFAFGRMQYIPFEGDAAIEGAFDPIDSFNSHFILRPHFLKRNEYKSEMEVLIVTTAPEHVGVPGIVLENTNPVDWIKAIRLWPGLKPLEEAALKGMIAGLIPGIPCACSDLYGADISWGVEGFTYNIVKNFGDLAFANWRNGSDGIPPELKEL